MTPEARVLRWKMPPYPASALTPSWMRAAGAVVQRDQRGARRDRHVHDLVNLGGVGLAQRAAEDPEVVCVDEDRAALDRAPAGDDTVGVRLLLLQAEPGRPVPAQLLDLLERIRVQEQLDALTRRELALGVLGLGRPVTRSAPGLLAQHQQFGHPATGVTRLARGFVHNGHVSTLRTRPRKSCRRLRTVY